MITATQFTALVAQTSMFERIYLGAFGFAVAGGVLTFVIYRSSLRWNRLVEAYAGNTIQFESHQTRQPENCIVRNKSGISQSYAGVVAISVNERGVGIRLMTPLNLCVPFHPPLFFPREEISLVPTYGFFSPAYLPTYGIKTDRCPEMEILIRDSVVEWIEEQLGIQRAATLEPVQS